jgi:5-methylcytosine-specific restriction endonuclease McrA
MKLDLRRKVFALNSKCVKCNSKTNLQIDHIYPKSKGGSDVLGNLQTLCARCNLKKGNKFESELFKLNGDAKSW